MTSPHSFRYMHLNGRRGVAAAFTLGALLASSLAACSAHSSKPAGSSASAGTAIGAPLPTSVTTASGTWSTIPMGQLDDPLNTFWEAFFLPTGTQRWVERTPPDVADNGGLIAAVTPTSVVIGFRPSDLLSFSPLASTTDGGVTYTPGLLAGGLANFPDALSVASSGRAVALTVTQVLTSASALAAWQPVATVATITASSAGRGCRPLQMTAVVATDAGTFIGTACGAPGVVGLVEQTGSTFTSVGLQLPGADVKDRVEVDRLTRDGSGVAALLGVRGSSGTSYIAAWNSTPGSATWTLSAPIATVGALVSTAVTSSGGFAVVTRSSSGALSAAVINGAGTNWAQLPSPPTGTATIAVSDARTDALAVDNATFLDYRLTAGQWVKAQTTVVAVPFGSSG
jgi:hypothetical protein